MSLHHSREQALAEIRNMPEQMFVDGLLLDCPKRRRREQAMGTRPMTIRWPTDLKRRFGVQYNRFVELAGKDLGLNLMLGILERWTDEDIRKVADDEHES